MGWIDYPAEHWIHLRTTNSIESTFATVRLRTKVTRGAGSRAAALAMVFRLVKSAQARRRAVNGAHLVPLVRAGALFSKGSPRRAGDGNCGHTYTVNWNDITQSGYNNAGWYMPCNIDYAYIYPTEASRGQDGPTLWAI